MLLSLILTVTMVRRLRSQTPLVEQLRRLQAQALDIQATQSPLTPFIAPLHHPMLPSRPVQPPSLQSKLPASLRCGAGSRVQCAVLDLLAHNPDFSIFVSMLRLADLVDILSLPGPITVFAPTNEAFDGLPTPLFKSLLSKPKELQMTLLRHMTKGRIVSSSFPSGSTPLITGAGEKLTVTTFPSQLTISR